MVKGNSNKIKDDEGNFLTISDPQFIQKSWNSQFIRNIRLSMLQGEKIDGCSTCYLQEESGRKSNREHANNEWAWRLGEEQLNNRFETAEENKGFVDNDLVYLDLRLGNLCNLKCRMCNPWNSSQIAKEHLELENKDPLYKLIWSKTFGKFPASVLDDQQWFDSNILWDQVIELIPSLKKVYMTGGEPTLIKNNFKFMQACIDQGRTDIVLFFNINCTNVNKQFLSLISQFDQVIINASIDGIGEVNNYIRYPSKWEQVSNNVESLASLPNVKLGITPTVQVYNIFDLVNILKWADELRQQYNSRIFVDFLINVHPYHLNVNILPDKVRNDVALNLEEYLLSSSNLPELTVNSTKGIIGLLKKSRVDNWKEQMNKFSIYTKSLDTEREQNFSKSLEILNRAINNEK
jgi:MoaA/NifB/PqqE/SkfB family radical SAM enzyme